jgi:hypothetical protein
MNEDFSLHVQHHAINCPANENGECNCGAKVSVEVPNADFDRAYKYLMSLERVAQAAFNFQMEAKHGDLSGYDKADAELTAALKAAKALKYG